MNKPEATMLNSKVDLKCSSIGGRGGWTRCVALVLVGTFPIVGSQGLVEAQDQNPPGQGTTNSTLEPGAARSANASTNSNGGNSVHTKDTLYFRNGDLLYGALQGIHPDRVVGWRHPDARDQIDFGAESISEIQLGPRPRPAFQPTNSCRVHLTNHDELEGNLVEFNSDKVVLESWYAGLIEIPRKRVQYLMPKPMQFPPVFEGIAGLEGWTIGRGSGPSPTTAGEWRYKNGALYAVQAASIARDVKLPEVACIQFDLAWKGMLYMAIALYTDYLHPVSLTAKENEPSFGGFYSLQLNNYTANLLPVTKHDPIRYLGQIAVPGFSQKNQAHVEIRVNKHKRSIALMADGVLLKQWIDTEGFIGQGTGMRFVHQGQGAVKLSNLRISEWDGQFDERPTNPPDSKFDLAKLQNGDRVTGTLQSIRENRMVFAPNEGPTLEVPVNRVKLVELAGMRAEFPRNDQANVRASFRGGGSVTFQLEKWDEQQVIGHSPNFGKVTFNPAAFERIQFLEASPKPTAGAAITINPEGV